MADPLARPRRPAAAGLRRRRRPRRRRPVVRPSDRADAQANGALAAGQGARSQPAGGRRRRSLDAADLDGVATAEIAGPGFINLTLEPSFLARAARRGRRRRPARHRAASRARAGRRRLLGAERGQGDAHRPPPHDGHRRRARAHARRRSATTSCARTTSATGAGRSGCSSSTSSTSAPSAAGVARRSATSTRSTRTANAKFAGRRRLPGAGPAAGRRCCSRATTRRWRCGGRSSQQSAEHWNDVYAKLGVLLTDDDLAGESRYEALMPEVLERLDAAGLLEESDGAEVVFPPGFTNREGEPLPLIVRSRAGAFTYATSDLACVIDRVERVGADAPALRRRRAAGPAPGDGVRRVARWPAGCVPPAEAEHVAFGNVLGDGPQDAQEPQRRAGHVRRRRRRGDRAGRGGGRREEPRPAGCRSSAAVGHAVGIGALKYADLSTDRDPRLRVRLGADAVVRRQHGAVPAVRPRPDLLDLPAGRMSTGPDVAGDGARARRAAGAGAGDAPARLRQPSSPRRSSGRARTACARTCTSWRRTSPRSTSTARCSRLRMPAPGRVAWR